MSNATVQVAIPSALCPTEDAQYCDDATTPVVCSNFAPAASMRKCDPTNPTNPTVCAVISGQATCIAATNQCDQCNGVFGTFPDGARKITEGKTAQGGAQTKSCDQTTTCYRDLGDTSTELFKSCTTLQSCFGYHTESACAADKCGRGACSWVPLEKNNPTTTKGYCRPESDVAIQCSDCTGMYCTPEVCQDIAGCFYVTDSGLLGGVSGCYAIQDLACEFYQDMTSCEGASGPFDIAVTYTNAKRTAGTHATLRASDDTSKLGKCAWFDSGTYESEPACRRDADENGVADIDEPPHTAAIDLALLRDFTNPVTSVHALPNASFPKQVIIPVQYEGKLYAKIQKEGVGAYPDKLATLNAGSLVATLSSGGWYELFYYSEDSARNLEVVRSLRIYVDTIPPSIVGSTITPTIIRTQANSFRTHVVVNFNTDENATCKTQLRDMDDAPVAPSTYGAAASKELTYSSYSQYFGVTYPLLQDGAYSLEITCKDLPGNENSTRLSLTADSDLTISDVFPQENLPRNASVVQIGATTNRSGTCRYGLPGATYDSMTPFTTTGTTTHRATIQTSTGRYQYRIACDIGGSLVYGGNLTSNNDDIFFAIDQLGPTTQLCDAKNTPHSATDCTAQPFKNYQSDSFAITLRCIDNPLTQFAFGCEKETIEFCLVPKGQTNCTPTPDALGNPTFNITGTEPVTLIVRAFDRGGNSEQLTRHILNLADKSAPIVSFTISP